MWDRCHDRLRPGDVVIAPFRGEPAREFHVLEDTGTGMFRVMRPDGTVAPMRPSTILAVAHEVRRSS